MKIRQENSLFTALKEAMNNVQECGSSQLGIESQMRQALNYDDNSEIKASEKSGAFLNMITRKLKGKRKITRRGGWRTVRGQWMG